MIALMLAAALQTAPMPPAPDGVVDNPCPAPLALPPEFVAYRAALYSRTGAKAVMPAAEILAGYRIAQAERAKTDWANLCRYRDANAKLAGTPPADRRIVFMGDSITEGWQYATPEFFAHGVIDRGISGQTTPQMLLRFTNDVLALKPRAVHIMAGINDIAGNTGPGTMADLQGNFAAMVTLAKAQGIRVVLASTLPAESFPWKPGIKPVGQVRELNAWLKAFAAREKVDFVDYYAVMATPEGAMKPEYTFDGVHPNAAGYDAIDALAKAAIAMAVR